MITINATIDKNQNFEVIKLLDTWPRHARRIEVRSVNKVATTERKKIRDAVRKKVNVRASYLNQSRIILTKANFSKPAAKIEVGGGRIPLIEFGAKDTKTAGKGVTYKINKNGPRKKIPDAWIASVRGGREWVLTRVGKDRYPISLKRGPSIPALVGNMPEFGLRAQETRVSTNLVNEIKNQANLIIK